MADPGVVTLTHVEIEPNNCALEESLYLRLEFHTEHDVPRARWVIKFIADQAHKRKIVLLGETPAQDYEAGVAQSIEFSIDSMDVSHLKQHVLANVGLLLATLYSGEGEDEQEMTQVSMLTQVTQLSDAEGGGLMRSVFSPIE